jgi:hypothetical protein
MYLTDKQITKFQDIYRQSFGKELSREEALDKGIKLVRLMQITYKSMTKQEFDNIEKRRHKLTNPCDEPDSKLTSTDFKVKNENKNRVIKN